MKYRVIRTDRAQDQIFDTEKSGLPRSCCGEISVFYKVNEEEKVVMIYAVADSRREYRHLV